MESEKHSFSDGDSTQPDDLEGQERNGLLYTTRNITTYHPVRWWIHHYLHLSILYSLIFALCVGLFLSYRSNTRWQDPSQTIYSPASDAVEYRTMALDAWFIEKSPYMGYPNDEIDARWESLYNFGVSTISASEARQLVNQTLARPGTEDYLVELDVFHELHCLNDLRKAFYPDRYPGKWPYIDGKVDYNSITFMHWDHCIDALRQTLMCHGDISPLPFHINTINGNLVPELATTHTCRDFEKIQEWARQRRTASFDPKSGLETD